ncbi:uncharacterized protein cubi_01412 [Cryptosporidium ubiquitum]|uniref:Uncharacterized protein n=1 Tax=Cryptosporidium ubiquitum TaxID=857276 RepID=A0A1J4MDL9_9CRYT|nr:uncharacterized protein cubi_01412 [Cryptosporidium ubiquitum]OII72079.1 hypothetical protein cubi_01412 [Cryptosporidium ubiquitum]
MNIRIIIFRVLLILNVVSYTYSERKKQLMSDSEIIISIDENISLLLKFARLISIKKSEQARKKCTIALKNLKTLNSATENGNVKINPLTNIALNGLIWHSDPCNDPNHIVKHIELYNLIKFSNLFSQISNLKQDLNNNKQINVSVLTTKSSFPQYEKRFKNTVFRSHIISKPFIKHKTSTKAISQEIQSRMDSLAVNKNDSHNAVNSTPNATSILDACETTTSHSQNNTNNVVQSGKESIARELQELARMKSVSSKSASGFSESLSRILSERGAS